MHGDMGMDHPWFRADRSGERNLRRSARLRSQSKNQYIYMYETYVQYRVYSTQSIYY